MSGIARLLSSPSVARLFDALDAAGGETRVVGGAVRNALLGEEPHDVDFATTLTPPEVTKAARDAGLRALPTGAEHGTITVIVDRAPFEVTTLREDVETDGRRAKVRFGADFEKDALRRDFTINALSLSRDGKLHDYAGGEADLAARRVRFIGDAKTRISEDYLRILRFFRFHARFGAGEMDAQGLSAAIALREGLTRLSRERIRTEILKTLVAAGAVDCVRIMSQSGIWETFLKIGYPARLERLALIERERCASPDALMRLAAAAVLTIEDAERVADSLRLSNAERLRLREAAAALSSIVALDHTPREHELLQLLFLKGREATRDAVTLALAESADSLKDAEWRAAAAFAEKAPAPSFPVNGGDLMTRGVPPGRALGAALKAFQANWIRAGFPKDPAALARLLDEAANGVAKR